jgi:hypothetical protein
VRPHSPILHRCIVRTAAITLVIAIVVTVASACEGVSKRATTISKLRRELAVRGVEARVVDRHSDLLGPPEVANCDPPLIAFRSHRDGFATIYVCESETQARDALLPELPGQRFRNGRIFAVIAADAHFVWDIEAAVRHAR